MDILPLALALCIKVSVLVRAHWRDGYFVCEHRRIVSRSHWAIGDTGIPCPIQLDMFA